MEKLTPGEPQSATDYDDRTSTAVKKVLIEIGQILGSFKGKFDSVDGFGPTCVRHFVEQSQVLGERTPEQWQQDAYGQIDLWLRALGIRGPA
ncbi:MULTISPECIES: hypothetical protein [Herbaspirillum]|uniref:hypothetical protein n=1 Tax=Herbaspirillum TaxID=963 RepID=UPI000C0AD687|nr:MULTISPECIES: hypothetical protein [Herbaspirillum]MAF04548.1 hypothetical protein [Herbaspirillum sp.]MBN9357125.1 hypothetical protein [Herbaspirillum huttiense]MBO15975.1 hypothetical protein [Herbaspirillum sp.]|tara:strand:- start:295 stop:570 length:276 start_codon:yes stop_codon:yes gene_type:complete